MTRIVTFLLLSSSLAFCQMASPSSIDILPSSFALNISGTFDGSGPYDVVILDSPFLEDEYFDGKTTIHGELGFVAKMRYNAAEHVIEFKNEDGIVKELLRRPYVSAEFNGKRFVVEEYLNEITNSKKLGYFNPLNEGNVQLLLRPNKKLKLSDYTFQQRKDGYYYDVSSYYIKTEGQPASRIVLNKSAILKNLDSKYEKILISFISKNNLNLKKEEDVICLLDYYDTLLIEPYKIEEQS